MSVTEPLDPAVRSFPLAAFGALVAGAMAMGISPVFVRVADVGLYASAFWRVALALPILAIWALSESGRAGVAKTFSSRAALLAGALFAGDIFFWHLAIMHTNIANATFLATMAPIWVVLGSWLLIGEKVERGVYIGLLLCIVGGAILIGGSWRLNPDHLVGDVFGLLTSVFFGLYFLAIRVARRDGGSGAIAFVTTLVTAALLFIVAAIMEPTLFPASLGGLAALFGLAFISHIGGQGLLTYALGHLSAAFSSLVIFVEAIAAAVFAWLLLSESLGIAQIIGGIAILSGIYLARPRT
jgi:drug/metabolite transporter (DMT)-like permease